MVQGYVRARRGGKFASLATPTVPSPALLFLALLLCGWCGALDARGNVPARGVRGEAGGVHARARDSFPATQVGDDFLQVKAEATAAHKMMSMMAAKATEGSTAKTMDLGVTAVLSTGFKVVSFLYKKFVQWRIADKLLIATQALFMQLRNLELIWRSEKHTMTISTTPLALVDTEKGLKRFKQHLGFWKGTPVDVLSSEVSALTASVSTLSMMFTNQRVDRLNAVVHVLEKKIWQNPRDRTREKLDTLYDKEHQKIDNERIQNAMDLNLEGYRFTPWQSGQMYNPSKGLKEREYNRYYFVCTHQVGDVYLPEQRPPGMNFAVENIGKLVNTVKCKRLVGRMHKKEPDDGYTKLEEQFCYRLWSRIDEKKMKKRKLKHGKAKKEKETKRRKKEPEESRVDSKHSTEYDDDSGTHTPADSSLAVIHDVAPPTQDSSIDSSMEDEWQDAVEPGMPLWSTERADAGYSRCHDEINRMRAMDGDPVHYKMRMWWEEPQDMDALLPPKANKDGASMMPHQLPAMMPPQHLP